jgi:hypothetical protein
MTKQEHLLMMTLFGVQFQLLTMMAEILQSRGVMTPDDVVPFLRLVQTYEPAANVAQTYVELARKAGVEIPL